MFVGIGQGSEEAPPQRASIAPKIGAARPPPPAPGVIVRGRSKPSQTPATRFGAIPTNQTSVLSSVVPVLPASWTLSGTLRRTALPVPRSTASRIIWSATYATAESIAGSRSCVPCPQSVRPIASCTRSTRRGSAARP